MNYNHQDPQLRFFLAGRILHVLSTAGFVEETDKHAGVQERVFSRIVYVQKDDGSNVATPVRVLVYTSIDLRSKEVRKVGTDAIRVCGVRTFKDGSDKGCIKRKRVNRTGKVADIEDRLLKRMRSAYKEAREAYQNPTKCADCGALNFISGKGNTVCSDLCFTKKVGYKPTPRRSSSRRSRRNWRRR